MVFSPYITLHHIHVFRGGRHILKNLSLTILKQEALILSGPNGIGKSTLLRVLAGFCPIESGEMIFSETAQHDHIAWLGYQDALKLGLSLEENLSFHAKFSKKTMKDILERLSLAHLAHYPTRLLSSGQRRRAAIARLYLNDAKIWLLDEPSNGIDTENMMIIGDIMEEHRQNGGTIIATSHTPLPLKNAREISLTPYSSHHLS